MKKSVFFAIVFSCFFVSGRAQQVSTIRIGGQIWMMSNLNIPMPGSWNYNDDPRLGAKYGRLYTYEAAKKSCPAGFRLPSINDWDELLTTMGGEDKAAPRLLKSFADGGFNAKLAGVTSVSNFRLIDSYGAYWTSTENDKDNAWFMYFTSKEKAVTPTYSSKLQGFSVRCIKSIN